MKQYLAFQAHFYYPRGGIRDFVGDFDSLEEARDAAIIAVKEDLGPTIAKKAWEYSWAHIYDSNARKTVWESPEE